MSATETMGDESEVPCPWCGKDVHIYDLNTDGCLEPHHVTDCPHCEQEFIILSVDWSATVRADRVEKEVAQ